MNVGLFAVDLAARQTETRCPFVSAFCPANLSGGSNLILRAVKRDGPVGTETGQTRRRDVWADRVLIRPQQRRQPVVADREVRDRLRVPTPRPDDPRQMRLR